MRRSGPSQCGAAHSGGVAQSAGGVAHGRRARTSIGQHVQPVELSLDRVGVEGREVVGGGELRREERFLIDHMHPMSPGTRRQDTSSYKTTINRVVS